MLVEVRVPVLAESIPDATLLEWKKHQGEAVARNEILIELETDKVVLEVPAPQAGVLAEIVHHNGDTVESEEVLARIDTEAKAAGTAPAARAEPRETGATGSAGAPEGIAEAGREHAPGGTGAPAGPEEAPGEAAPFGKDPRPSPAARKAAAERGLDLAQISGTGRDGRITKEDVLAHDTGAGGEASPAPAGELAPAPVSTPDHAPPDLSGTPGRVERREKMSRLRARIAERLKESQNRAAILTTFNEVDMGPVMAMRRRYREDFEKAHGVRLGFMSFFARAAVRALQRFPAVNAYIEGTDIVYHDYCDIGVAVGSPRGLVVPILHNVEGMSFAEIESKIADFGNRAREGSLRVEEMSGGTFTISNGGVFGSLLSTPILNPPQSAILGMHKTEDRPVIVDGEVVVRPMMYLALSYDHRIIDGREAVLFLVTIKEAIEDPTRLLLDV